MPDYWQLEESTDQWQLEESTDLWELEESAPVVGAVLRLMMMGMGRVWWIPFLLVAGG